MSATLESVIRPSAVLPVDAAARIVAALRSADVGRGGVWNASSSIWQRYDRPWAAAGGGRGGAELVGSIAVVYDQPRRNEITIYKVTISPPAASAGWTTERLCDDALAHAGLSLATCPRADLKAPPAADPFRSRAPGSEPSRPLVPEQRSVWTSDVGELLRRDVRDLFGNRR